MLTCISTLRHFGYKDRIDLDLLGLQFLARASESIVGDSLAFAVAMHYRPDLLLLHRVLQVRVEDVQRHILAMGPCL